MSDEKQEDNQLKKDTILKEQLWFTITMVTINGFCINMFPADNFNIKTILGILFLGILNLFSTHLVLNRANAYRVTDKKTKLNWFDLIRFVITELSGSFFYVLLIIFSFFAVLFFR